jgi:hypothetical protein
MATTREDLLKNLPGGGRRQLGTAPTSKKAVKKKAATPPPPPPATPPPPADTSKTDKKKSSSWVTDVLRSIFNRKGGMVKGYARGGGVRPADNEYR